VTLLFVGWWGTAALSIYGLWPISERTIAVAAFSGAGLGILLDVLFLRRWVASFYTWAPRWLALLYLSGSAVAVALLMGLPFLNVIWGALAGAYVGRRVHYGEASDAALRRVARVAGAFTALVTGLEALPIGLMALNEGIAVRTIRAATGWSAEQVAGAHGVLLIIVLCLVLMALQMCCTRAAARLAFQL
jgi:hypothetical protein